MKNDPLFHDDIPAPKKRRRRTPKKDSEAAVLKECLTFLNACEQVVYVERRNTGAVAFQDGGFMRFGSPGAADIWCLIKWTKKNEWGLYEYIAGRSPDSVYLLHIEIEVKKRDGKGKLSPNQIKFEHFCIAVGIPYIVVTSAEDLAGQLKNSGFLA